MRIVQQPPPPYHSLSKTAQSSDARALLAVYWEVVTPFTNGLVGGVKIPSMVWKETTIPSGTYPSVGEEASSPAEFRINRAVKVTGGAPNSVSDVGAVPCKTSQGV